MKGGRMVTKHKTSKALRAIVLVQAASGVLFGIAALFWTQATLEILINLFALYIVVWGIVSMIVALTSLRSRGLWLLELAHGLIAIGVGAFLLRNGVDTVEVFGLLVGIALFVRGIVDFLHGLFGSNRLDSGARFFFTLGGLLGLVAGLGVLLYPQGLSLGFVWVMGLYAVLHGTILIAWSLHGREK